MDPEEVRRIITEAVEFVNNMSDKDHANAIDCGLLDRRFDRRCPDYKCQLKKNHEGKHRMEWE